MELNFAFKVLLKHRDQAPSQPGADTRADSEKQKRTGQKRSADDYQRFSHRRAKPGGHLLRPDGCSHASHRRLLWTSCNSRSLSERKQRRNFGGEGGIRTHEPSFARLPAFEAGSFNRSDTSPRRKLSQEITKATHERQRLK